MHRRAVNLPQCFVHPDPRADREVKTPHVFLVDGYPPDAAGCRARVVRGVRQPGGLGAEEEPIARLVRAFLGVRPSAKLAKGDEAPG